MQTISPTQLSHELRETRSPDLAEQAPTLPLAAAAKALFDVVTCVRLGQEEWAANKALCSWCQVATVLSVAVFALTVPEAVRAGRALA